MRFLRLPDVKTSERENLADLPCLLLTLLLAFSCVSAAQAAVKLSATKIVLIKGQKKKAPMVIKDNCVKCLTCVTTLACPAISYLNDKVVVDEALCKSCTVCIQVCPNKAIGVKKGD